MACIIPSKSYNGWCQYLGVVIPKYGLYKKSIYSKQRTVMETTTRIYYPAYMRRKRHPKSEEQVNNADQIRQRLKELASKPNFTVEVMPNGKARIGCTGGMGFSISHELAQYILNSLAPF